MGKSDLCRGILTGRPFVTTNGGLTFTFPVAPDRGCTEFSHDFYRLRTRSTAQLDTSSRLGRRFRRIAGCPREGPPDKMLA